MHPRQTALLGAAMRGAALFLAALTVIGLVGELRGRTLDLSLWWIDLRNVPFAARVAALAAFAGLLGWWAALPAPGPWRRRLTVVALATFAGLAARDSVRFYGLVATGEVRPFLPVPLSLAVAVLLVGVAVAVLRARAASPEPRRALVAVLAGAAGWAIVFPLAQMLFFGTTDYRRPADAAVVFGARVYASGAPSPLLADRIATGVELYRQALVPYVVMSGGDGSDGFNEARAMRDAAVDAGMDPAAVIVDPVGVSTEVTVVDVAALLASGEIPGTGRIIVVSQAYHLPRVQLAFQQAGLDVLTVPAPDPEPIGEMPILVAREVLAFWSYYLRICLAP